MAPAPQEPETASPTTNRPDGESSVDNIAQAATTLEANLTNLESRLDALLAAFEANEKSNQGGTAAPQNENSKEEGTAHHGVSDREKEDGSGSYETARKP
ncbi:hypothetical protein LZ31DRAFT_590111 [Colletotrichum somersetense]|nr:hypothetical protein LZ31DRAFT_590111 [Colletotrichum somersetense]